MHSKIFQISREPIETYKEANDYLDTGFMAVADYTDDISNSDRSCCIDRLSKYLGDGADIKDNVMTIKDKKTILLKKLQSFRRTLLLLQSITEDDFCSPVFSGGERGIDSLMYHLNESFSDKYGFYVDIDDLPIPITDFLRNTENGERYYIGAVIDYHF